MFSKKEIQDKWLDAILDNSSRMKALTLDTLPDKFFTFFGKTETGIKKGFQFYIKLITNLKFKTLIRHGKS